jgi:hypothetical protein
MSKRDGKVPFGVLVGCLLFAGVTSGAIFLYKQSVIDGCTRESEAICHAKGDLTTACKSYWRNNDQHWPPDLDALTQPDKNGKVYLDGSEALIDPWRNRFQYDPGGPRNNGQQPDIWAKSPKGEVIGNWPSGK